MIAYPCLFYLGRISLSDLQQSLNVHYQTVEDQAKQVVETQSDFTFCLGQLITRLSLFLNKNSALDFHVIFISLSFSEIILTKFLMKLTKSYKKKDD